MILDSKLIPNGNTTDHKRSIKFLKSIANGPSLLRTINATGIKTTMSDATMTKTTQSETSPSYEKLSGCESGNSIESKAYGIDDENFEEAFNKVL